MEYKILPEDEYKILADRKEKEYEGKCWFEIEEKKEIEEKNTKESIKRKELLEKYIENEEFQSVIDSIKLSQLSRFYSLLEERNFSFASNFIKEFVTEQMGREQSNEFYEFFKETFLNGEFEKENEKNKVIFEMIKRYVRYSIGQKKLNGEKGEN